MQNVKFKNGLYRKANKLENERCVERVGVTLDELTSQVCDILNIHESQIDIYIYDDEIRWRYKNLYIFNVEVDNCKAGYNDSVLTYFYGNRFMQDKEWKKNEEKFKEVCKFLQSLIKEKQNV